MVADFQTKHYLLEPWSQMTDMMDLTMNDATERRAQIVEKRKLETGIDEAMIDRLVRQFYGKVRLDPDLGPIFNERVTDWENHFVRLSAFWSSVTLSTGAYTGSPVSKHLGLPVDSRHFDQWLRLFGMTVMELCPPVSARVFLERAMRIAESMELAIAGDLGLILAKDERLIRPELQTTL